MIMRIEENGLQPLNITVSGDLIIMNGGNGNIGTVIGGRIVGGNDSSNNITSHGMPGGCMAESEIGGAVTTADRSEIERLNKRIQSLQDYIQGMDGVINRQNEVIRMLIAKI